jgi:hypothetical protein
VSTILNLGPPHAARKPRRTAKATVNFIYIYCIARTGVRPAGPPRAAGLHGLRPFFGRFPASPRSASAAPKLLLPFLSLAPARFRSRSLPLSRSLTLSHSNRARPLGCHLEGDM